VTKAKAYKVAGQEGSPGVKESVREWTFTFPKELPLQENDCKGQNPMVRRVLYTIGKLLKRRCLKWARITHLDIWNTSYGQKKGIKLVVWLPTTKTPESTWFPYVQVVCNISLENFKEGYNFVTYLISIRGLHTKLWGPKVARVPTLVISRLPLGSPGTKSHLDVGFVERHKVYYNGEVGGFPQVQAVVSLVNSNCSWLVLTPKTFQLCINHLVLVLCRSVWVVDTCHSS